MTKLKQSAKKDFTRSSEEQTSRRIEYRKPDASARERVVIGR